MNLTRSRKLNLILEMMKRKDKNFEFPKCTAIEDEDDLPDYALSYIEAQIKNCFNEESDEESGDESEGKSEDEEKDEEKEETKADNEKGNEKEKGEENKQQKRE